MFLKFLANFIEVTHYIMLPINIAICNKHVLPLKEADTIIVCGIFFFMGALSLIIKLFIQKKGTQSGERAQLLGTACFTMIGLALQLKVVNRLNIFVCIFGFILSYIAINILDGSLISLISQFVPAEFMAYKGFVNISFLHV